MSAIRFLDTNILVYAYEIGIGHKREVAAAHVAGGFLNLGSAAISVQVLQELYVTLLRKGLTHGTAKQFTTDLTAWTIVENSVELFRSAI